MCQEEEDGDSELSKISDEGEDISKYLNLSKARRPEQEQKIYGTESKYLGVPRQSITERLEKAN